MFKTNCNDEISIRLIGKLSLEIPILAELETQLKVRKVIEEVLYNYNVSTKETGLITSDIEDKINIFIACRNLDGLSKKTLNNYRQILLKFSDFFHKPLISITTMDIRLYISRFSKNKATTNNTLISVLKTFFSWCVNEEYIIKNPMAKINKIKVEKRLRKAMNDEQVELLLDACKTTREKAILGFLLFTGCRVGEIVNINMSDIDWNEMSLNVIGKGSKERRILFNNREKLLLQNYLKDRKCEDNSLFCSSKFPYTRLGIRAIEKEVKNIANRSNVDINVFPHLCRHTYGTSKINSGMSLGVLQVLMGHSSPSTTISVYSKISDENINHEYRKSN